MKKGKVKAYAHRFHDWVAVSIGNGGTVYITANDARKFTRAINKIARSCRTERFIDSHDLTAAFDFDGADANG